MISDHDLILEAVKNSVEAGAKNIELYIEDNTFTVIDDGVMEKMPTLGVVGSQKGENRGRGLYLLYLATGGDLSLERNGGKTILKAAFKSRIEPSEIVPSCFNLTELSFHRIKDGKEAYYINKDILAELGIESKKARDLARLKRIIGEKELRS